MASDPSVVKQAREWIDRVDAGRGLSNSWRLQVIQKRYRKRDVPAQGGLLDCDSDSCVGLPMRIRRFVPGCPWALVHEAVRYLICKAPYSGIIYNGLEIPGTYRPTLTTWQRDEKEIVDEQKPQNGTYTLIQDLVEEGCEDEETVVTGETCSFVETTEYHWDDSTPGELPGCGSECDGSGTCQGVTYAIRSSRNDDGTFDWQLVKRVAKTQHAGPFDVECNGCTGRVTQETWDNLYGDPVSGYEARYGADCPGEAVALPGCDDEPGVKTQVQVAQNPDCTYKVTVTRRENLEYSDAWTDGSPCQVRTVTEERNLKDRPADPVPSVGETVRVQLKRNDDCTYDRTVEVTRSSGPYAYGWTDGSRCRKRTVTVLKDQRTKPEVPEVGPGETLDASIQRNQDCTWDAQFSVRKPYEGDDVEWEDGPGCRRRSHTLWIDRAERPEISDAPPGGTLDVSLSFDPSSCTWSGKQVVTSPSSSVEDSWETGDSLETSVTTHYQNSPVRPQVPSVECGRTVQASFSQNADCTWDGNVTVREAQEYGTEWDDGSCMAQTHTEVVRNAKDPPPAADTPEGTVVSIRSQRNPDCTYDYSVTTRESVEKTSGWHVWESVEKGKSSTSTYENGTMVFYNVKDVDSFVRKNTKDGHAYSVELHMNEDCTYSGTIRYKDLVSWTDSGSGHDGGIHENDEYQTKDSYGNVWSIPLITFTGSGNEGTWRSWCAKGATWLPNGVRLNGKTVAKYVKLVSKPKGVPGNPYAHFPSVNENPTSENSCIVSPVGTTHNQDNTGGAGNNQNGGDQGGK